MKENKGLPFSLRAGFARGVVVFLILGILGWFATALWAADCPQPRNTRQAPSDIFKKNNPLDPSFENLLAGKALFENDAKPLACKYCHGTNGDGRGSMAVGLNPPPRDFTCAKTIDGVPDGQLYWIIKNGSEGTGMPAFEKLEDEEVWQLILYLRKLARSRIARGSESIGPAVFGAVSAARRF